jgi:tetratricopeptide (TPR) repeat protein
MDLQDRLSQLENVRDWQGVVEELEKGIATGESSAAKASYHLRLGRILESKFLAGVKALKHFQDAYKLNPGLIESLEAARRIYWDLGKLNMVQKLIELELKAAPEAPNASGLLLDLGDVLRDLGDYDKATATYARSLAASGGRNQEASACLEDVQVEAAGWQAHVATILRAAHQAKTPEAKSRLFLRAARVTRRFAPPETEGMLAQAYAADPSSKQAAALYEGMLAEAGRADAIEHLQHEIETAVPDRLARAKIALLFGTRWVSRHQNIDRGAKFLEEAVKLNPENEGAFHFLTDAYGQKAGDWDRVLAIAEEAATHAGENGNATFLLAQAGTIAWRQLGNLIRARASFQRLSAVAPEHPQLRAFEAQIGETLKPVLMPVPAQELSVLSSIPVSMGSVVPVAAAAAPPPDPPKVEAPPPVQARAVVPVAPPPSPPATAAARPELASDPAKVPELLALAEKQESAKRYNEYVKTLLALALAVPDPDEKISYYLKAADLYVTKFANQAEGVKAYEQVIAIDPDNPQAVDYLRQMYEKRRDWEKLLGLQRREAERIPQGSARAAKFLEIAKLATERVKKPEVCIELWQEVLRERRRRTRRPFRRWLCSTSAQRTSTALASVLEKQAEVTYDAPTKIQILTKLGTIYGDRLNNDEGAVAAWRTLLTLDPNDRKAQEALKKKYLALGRWDDLEVFYAESGKWDEFIRVLEQQEAKETSRTRRSVSSSRSPSFGATRSRRATALRSPTRRFSRSNPAILPPLKR